MKLTIKYSWILILCLWGCNKKISNTEVKMKTSNESQLLEFIIPHQDNLIWITNLVDNIEENHEKIFRNDKYIYREKELNIESIDLKNHLINDHLQDEQYWIPIKDLDTNHKIWHWLSVFVGNYNILEMRNHLTNEIYDNPNFNKDIDRLSNLFEKTDYLIYQIDFQSDKSIGILKKKDFTEFVLLAKKMNMTVVELKID